MQLICLQSAEIQRFAGFFITILYTHFTVLKYLHPLKSLTSSEKALYAIDLCAYITLFAQLRTY